MLSDYKDQIGTAAGVSTLIQMLSPMVMCKDIVYKGSSAGVDVMPFIGGAVLSSMFLQLSVLIGDVIMMNVNIIAFILGLAYLAVYYVYSDEKAQFHNKFSKAFAFVAVLVGYAQLESTDVIEFRFGLIATIVLLAFVTAPLFGIGTILKTKNTDSLPMPLIISGSAVSFLWFLYGIAINDAFLQIQNIIVFLIQALQIGIFLYVKLQKPVKKEDKKD